MISAMIPFSFQKGNKIAGCEDAPPIANFTYSVVCDGLGGAGSTKHTVLMDGFEAPSVRTSGYLGARIVSSCVDTYYAQNAASLFTTIDEYNRQETISVFLNVLKTKINSQLEEKMQSWGIKPSHSKTLKNFPTTLASAIFVPHARGVTILAVWAGDSRVYVMTPQKGLQLLSLDDAKNAESEMNSTSEMTNCISSGNAFHLNYAFYELNEPGIVFCCSDGCFDYLQSPLHFEWLLLHTMLEYLPDSAGAELGVTLAESICNNMYKTIGDDTTMAGVIVGMDSSSQMKSLYQNRMIQSDKLAIDMNSYLKELKRIQNERDAAQKTCRLFEGKILSLIHQEVCFALQPDNPSSLLRTKLLSMPCYTEYVKMERAIDQDIEKEREAEFQRLQAMTTEIKSICRSMLIRDYLNWQRKAQFKTDPSKATQLIMTCIEMFKHPCFKEVVSRPSYQNIETDEIIQTQISQLESLMGILENSDRLFEDLWSQAFFSTDVFINERCQYEANSQFDTLLDYAIYNPQSYEFVSELSARKIMEYHERRNGYVIIQEKYENERKRRLKTVPEEFWMSHKDEILEMVLSENEATLQFLFGNTTVKMEQLISYIEAKKTLVEINTKIGKVQFGVDRIWDEYKTDYQLFKRITEKGVC